MKPIIISLNNRIYLISAIINDQAVTNAIHNNMFFFFYFYKPKQTEFFRYCDSLNLFVTFNVPKYIFSEDSLALIVDQ